MSINTIINFAGKKLFSKNIPQYLYHLTPKKNYQQMVQDGCIKQTHDSLLNKDAIFTIEKNNYMNKWANTKIKNEYLNDMLLSQVDYTRDTVVLRIPTKNLNLQKLFVRNQKKYFGFAYGEYDTPIKNPIKFIQTLKVLIHLRYGTPAYLKKFQNSNNAYEYIYKDSININNIDSVIPLKQFLKNT